MEGEESVPNVDSLSEKHEKAKEDSKAAWKAQVVLEPGEKVVATCVGERSQVVSATVTSLPLRSPGLLCAVRTESDSG